MRCPAPADARASNATAQHRRTVMVLFASAYDQSRSSRRLISSEKRSSRIKDGHRGNGSESAPRRRRSSSSGSPTMSAALCSIAPTTARSAVPSATPSKAGPARSSSCFRPWPNSAARWAPPAGAHSAAEASQLRNGHRGQSGNGAAAVADQKLMAAAAVDRANDREAACRRAGR